MNVSDSVKLNLNDLPVDIFEVADLGLSTKTLTAGHGMPENGASIVCFCVPMCSCMYPGDEEEVQN